MFVCIGLFRFYSRSICSSSAGRQNISNNKKEFIKCMERLWCTHSLPSTHPRPLSSPMQSDGGRSLRNLCSCLKLFKLINRWEQKRAAKMIIIINIGEAADQNESAHVVLVCVCVCIANSMQTNNSFRFFFSVHFVAAVRLVTEHHYRMFAVATVGSRSPSLSSSAGHGMPEPSMYISYGYNRRIRNWCACLRWILTGCGWGALSFFCFILLWNAVSSCTYHYGHWTM